MQNNTQSQMQGTIHTNLQVFIYIFIYIAGRPTQWVLCSYWSQVIMWTILLPYLFDFQKSKSLGSKAGREESNMMGQVQLYKYVRNKGEGGECGTLLVKAFRPLWSIVYWLIMSIPNAISLTTIFVFTKWAYYQ